MKELTEEDLVPPITNQITKETMFKQLINKIFHKPEEISFKAGLDLTSIPVVTLYQGDKKFNFLLDTGSNSCIINKSDLPKIEHKVMEGEAESIVGMEGTPVMANRCMITLYFGNRGYEYSYLINDMSQAFNNIKQTTGVTLHGIIGSSFFNKFKYVLDFDKLVAYSKL